MRAMVLPQYGGPELFEPRDVEAPHAGPGEVRVKVFASAVNPVDAKIRANGYGTSQPLPAILGSDAAGVIDEVGGGVTEFKAGDAVYYTPEFKGRGTYAEFHVVPASIIALKPSSLSFAEAAAVPLAGGTAWEAVVRRLSPRPGETVLLHGAAGGVGAFALMFAKACGAKVLATASAGNLAFLRELGADVALDYAADDVVQRALEETGGRGVDTAFDVEGQDRVARCLPAVRPFGRVACILPPQGDLTLLYRKNLTLHGVMLTREKLRLEEMRPVFEQGKARVILDEVLPLERVAEAHRRLDSRHGRGKVVLQIA